MNYEILALALNRVAESSHFNRIAETLHRYISNPALEVPSYISEYNQLLIKIGRERPMYFTKLMEIVDQIRMGTGNPELYTEEQWATIDEALDELYTRDRPTKLIDAIKRAAATDLPWRSALGKTALKPFAPLVKLYRGSPAKFEDFIKVREYIRRDKLRTKRNERHKDAHDRLVGLTALVQFKNKWFDPKTVAREATDRLHSAMEDRHNWVKHRPQGVSAVEASYQFWQLYDKQLDDALAMIDRAKRGASVIAKEVKYPKVDTSQLRPNKG